MKQEVYMPNEHKIFESENPAVQYPAEVLKSMDENGYKVRIDGRVWHWKKGTKNGELY